jgi:hypothetical protein
MKNQTVQRWVSLGVGLLWMVSAGASSALADGGGQGRPTMRISVYNDAGLKRATLMHAEKDASTVFDQAGIDIEWKNCGKEEIVEGMAAGKRCGEAAYPTRLVLRIQRRPRGLIAEPMGVAFLSEGGQGAYCDVFLEPMEELQRTQPVSLDVLLGHVAAHEIAHLLLGPRSHSMRGVMRARWGMQAVEELKRGTLGFDSKQSEAMVERLEIADGGVLTTECKMAPEFVSLPQAEVRPAGVYVYPH